MRTLLKHIDSLDKKERIVLAETLCFSQPQKTTAKNIVSRMSSYTGIELILSKCTDDERTVLHMLSQNDLHYRDIEHSLHIPMHTIENIAQSLSNKSIIYILKNRQLLSSKLDKIHLFNELRPFIKPIDEQTFRGLCNTLIQNISSKKSHADSRPLSHHSADFLDTCIRRGCIVSVKYAIAVMGITKAHSILTELSNNNAITINHIFSRNFAGIIIVNPDCMRNMQEKKINYIHNHYLALITMLYAHDCITSYGLFLTREGNLRKPDVDKITKVLNPVSLYTATHQLSKVQKTQLALFLLSAVKCLSVSSTNVNAPLGEIQGMLLHPHRIVQRIIDAANNEVNTLFPNPLSVNADSLKSTMKIIRKYSTICLNSCSHIYFLESLYTTAFQSNRSIDDLYDDIEVLVKNSIDFLCVLGIITIRNNVIHPSDIDRLLTHPDTKDIAAPSKSIYINPDFSLVIPYHDLASEILYLLLSYTEISSIDVTIHAKISKNGILNAAKRGMQSNVFIALLKQYTKNQFPQNILFQLNEWIEKTPKISIKRGIILRSNRKEFIDELLLNTIKGVSAERISDNHIIISESSLEAVIKYAQKKDTVITVDLTGI